MPPRGVKKGPKDASTGVLPSEPMVIPPQEDTPQETVISASKGKPLTIRTGKPLDQVDMAILSEYRRNPIITDVQVGKRLGIHRNTINLRRQNPSFRRALEDVCMPAREVLKRAANSAALKLERLTASQDEDVAARASLGILRHVVPIKQEIEAGEGFQSFIKAIRDIPEEGKKPTKED